MADPGPSGHRPACVELDARTRLLLVGIFPNQRHAEDWLDRENPALGGRPRRLVAAGREREVQRYLAQWLLPVEVPPQPFERLQERNGHEP